MQYSQSLVCPLSDSWLAAAWHTQRECPKFVRRRPQVDNPFSLWMVTHRFVPNSLKSSSSRVVEDGVTHVGPSRLYCPKLFQAQNSSSATSCTFRGLPLPKYGLNESGVLVKRKPEPKVVDGLVKFGWFHILKNSARKRNHHSPEIC